MDPHEVTILLARALHGDLAAHTLFDLDGVLCVNYVGGEPEIPPDEELPTGDPYRQHLRQALPLFKPSRPILGVVSGRLQRYAELSEAWLHAQEIGRLQPSVYHPAALHTAEMRQTWPSSLVKSAAYRQTAARLFVESHEHHGRAIAHATKRPVLVVATMQLIEA